jgi:hypothetical protein
MCVRQAQRAEDWTATVAPWRSVAGGAPVDLYASHRAAVNSSGDIEVEHAYTRA